MDQVRTPHYYPEVGWGVFSCQREEHTWEVQKIDDLDILQSDYDAINLARMKGYKVTNDLIVTNMGDMIAMEVTLKNHQLNKNYVLSLQELTELVDEIIKKKFWSVTNLGTSSTQELIIEHLNN